MGTIEKSGGMHRFRDLRKRGGGAKREEVGIPKTVEDR